MRRFSFAFAACAALLLASAPALDAQTIGFKLGATMSKIVTEPDSDLDGLTAFAGGGFIRFDFGRIGIQPEILTITKGQDEDLGKLELEYIEVPVLLHLPLSMGSTFAPYVIAGPAFGFEVGCQVETTTETDCDDAGLGAPQDRKSTDIGITAGGGLAFGIGPGAVLLEGRYNWGLTNILDTDGDASMKNRYAAFFVGFAIPLSR
jgi:hypothetical protein